MNHDFSADRPIADIDEDLLDRGGFAESLARAIAGWKDKDSLIVALHGDWGSGKSSLKNMMLSAFGKHNLEAPLLVEFNPWEWAGQDKISKSFFEQLAASIGQRGTSKKRKAIAEKIRRYGLYLNSGAFIVTGLGSALPTLFALAALFGLSGIFSDHQWVERISGFLLTITVAWAAFLKWGGELADRLSKIISEHTGGSEPKLDSLKSSLASDLGSLDKTVLVIIDDIDRLTREETRMVFQLVKANADFPNVVYLLLFQRDIVENRLTDETQNGGDYLEKIIQVPFDIPKIEQERLEKVLFASLDRILEEDESTLKRFDQTRWGNLYYGGLQQFFKTLRNIYRFSSTLSFHVSLMKGQKAFEVNPIDLIAIECLRIFEPAVYKQLRLSKELLTTGHSDQLARERGMKEIDLLLQTASDERRESVKQILKQIFIPLNYIEGPSYSCDAVAEWLKELRACHPDVFPRYFQFAIPSTDISESDLDEIITHSGDRSRLYDKLKALEEAGLLKAALRQLDAYKQDVSLEYSDAFIPALMDIGDQTDNESIGRTGFSAHVHLVRIILWYLRQADSVKVRGEKLLSAFAKTEGLSVMARLLRGEEERRKKEDEADLLLTDDATLDVAKKEFLLKLERIAKSEPTRLLHNLHLAALLFRWKEWGNANVVRTWVESNVATNDNLLAFLDRFARQVISQYMSDYVGRISYRISLNNIEEFCSLERVRELSKNCNRNSLNDRERVVLSALDEAFRRRDSGQADDAWDD